MNTISHSYAKTILGAMLFFLIGILASGCAKEKSDPQSKENTQEAFSEGMAADAEEPGVSSKRHRSESSPKVRQTKGQSSYTLEGHGIPLKHEALEGRLLEYFVSLRYKSEDFAASRRTLIEIVSRYGFIADSSSVAGENPHLNSTIRIQADKLYEVLKELDRLGDLESERIQTTDHTEGMVLQMRRIRRERLRQLRRSRAASNASRKDWAARERLLSQSEDKEDRAEHEKWKIRDRISWAEIQVYVEGPKEAPRIQVPVYRAAFVGLINLLLELSYILIYLVPFALLLLGAYLGAKSLWQRIVSRKNK